MTTFKIYLFGKFCVQHKEQRLDGFEARKVQELFCYLLLHRDHSFPREVLASLLWPDSTTVQSKKNLRQVLWQLQSALRSPNKPVDRCVLLVEPDRIQLDSQAGLFWLDVVVLEQAFNLVQKIPDQEMDPHKALVLEDAVQLYQGSLLEGWYQDWCIHERERLQGMYLALLDKLMGYYGARHDYETGILHGGRIMCYDRARERTHRRLMHLHYLNGDRAAALRQYAQCAVALGEELGASPSKGTVRLYEQILADQLLEDEPAPISREVAASREGTDFLLPGILDRLVRLQGSLSDLQVQVEQSIETLEQALEDCSVPT
jgi:DNA-binding SARP family transcriptional activator